VVRQVVVAFTEPNSPATAPSANLARGAQVLTVDGVDLVNANDSASVDKLNAGLFPPAPGVSHSFSILDLGASTPRTVTMVHTQRPQLTVAVENATGQPVEDVLVTFTPSEGTFTTSSSRTRGGTVVGTFVAAASSDSPRTAFLVAAVEDVEVTIFIDIVPAVFGR